MSWSEMSPLSSEFEACCTCFSLSSRVYGGVHLESTQAFPLPERRVSGMQAGCPEFLLVVCLCVGCLSISHRACSPFVLLALCVNAESCRHTQPPQPLLYSPCLFLTILLSCFSFFFLSHSVTRSQSQSGTVTASLIILLLFF